MAGKRVRGVDGADEKRLARYRRYNSSKKGQDRNKKYEDAHPERRTRWAPVMIWKGRQSRV
jgi:hypothetical protein